MKKNQFVYTGLNVTKVNDGLTKEHIRYIKNLKPAIFNSRDKHKPCFPMVSLSTKVTNSVIADLMECNQLIAEAHREQVQMNHSKLAGEIRITVFGDAASRKGIKEKER